MIRSIRPLVRPHSGLSATSRSKSSTPPEQQDQHRPQEIQDNSRILDRLPYASAKTGDFVQPAPRLQNAYESDAFLRRCLTRLTPRDAFESFESDLVRFGEMTAGELWDLGRQCEEVRIYNLA